MKTTSIKLPPDLAKRTEALKRSSGLSESAILRAAIAAGLARVEYGVQVMTDSKVAPESRPEETGPERAVMGR